MQKLKWALLIAIIVALVILGFFVRAENGWDFEAARAENLDRALKQTETVLGEREERIGSEARKIPEGFYAVEYGAHCLKVPDRGLQLELCRNGAYARTKEDAAREWREILKRATR